MSTSRLAETYSGSEIRIAHVITDLGAGGAEMMLYRLLEKSDRSAFFHQVYSLTDEGPIAERIRRLNLPVASLGMRRTLSSAARLLRLKQWLRDSNPHLVQTWLYHADLLGGVIARWDRVAPVVWSVHHTHLDPREDRRTTIWTARACARLSGVVPASIVCCSQTASRVHQEMGYAEEKIVVIPNGFDMDIYQRDDQGRRLLRQEIGAAEDVILIGTVGRDHPQKDHATFMKAASILSSKHPEIQFVLCGPGLDETNESLLSLADRLGIRSITHFLGYREDVVQVYSSLDVFTLSSSHGEAFPNVIGEAMACEVPCVVTDVGDSAEMVGGTGFVVDPKNPEALAGAWRRMLDVQAGGRMRLGRRARERIQSRYTLPSIVQRYEGLYRNVLERG